MPPAAAPPATAPPATATPGGGASASGVDVHFSQKAVQTAAGKTFTVSIVADKASDLGAAPIELKFDPKLLRLNEVLAGDLLAQGGAVPLVVKNIQNESGSATVQVSRQPGLKGATGSGAILTLTFSALGPGDTQVMAPNIILRNSQGQPAGTASPGLSVHIQ